MNGKREKYDEKREGGEVTQTVHIFISSSGYDHTKAFMIFFCYSTKILRQNFNTGVLISP
jgi:hypothetical protein